MSESRYYPPKNGREPYPVVLAFPGLVHYSEENKCDLLLEELIREGIARIRVNYSGISRSEGNNGLREIRCEFNLQKLIEDIGSAFEKIKSDERIDKERVGVFAPSISAGLIGHYFAKEWHFPPRAYASLSPLTGWDAFGRENLREFVAIVKDINN